MTTVLVTGANGHVGANAVRSLLARGHDVIPMVRQGSDLRGLEGLGLTCRYADVLDANAVAAAMEGCDVVVHCAAVYALWAKNAEEISAPSVMGTQNVYRAAQAAGVRRIVYTSSVVAVGYSYDPETLRTVADWNDDAKNPYFMAKVQGERDAIRLSEETGIDTIRLCPGVVLGPWAYRCTPSMAVYVRDLVNGSSFTWEGGTNLVHAGDVGEVHALAVDHGMPGTRYILGGSNIHLHDLGNLIEKHAGVKVRHVGVSRRTGMAVGSLMEIGSRLLGKEPQLTRSGAHEAVHRYGYFELDETNRTFGLTPKGADETVRDAIRWLLHVGEIKRELAPEAVARLAPAPEWV